MATLLGSLDARVDFDLYLPIDGIVYRIPAPALAEADRLRELPWLSYKELPADVELAELEKLLGPALDQMRRNDVKAPRVYHAGRTAVIHFAYPQGPQMGRIHWLLGDLSARIDFVSLQQMLAEGVDMSAIQEQLQAAADAQRLAAARGQRGD